MPSKTSIRLTKESSHLLTLYIRVRGIKTTKQALSEIIAVHLGAPEKDFSVAAAGILQAAAVVKSGAHRRQVFPRMLRDITLHRATDRALWDWLDRQGESRGAAASRAILAVLRPPLARFTRNTIGTHIAQD